MDDMRQKKCNIQTPAEATSPLLINNASTSQNASPTSTSSSSLSPLSVEGPTPPLSPLASSEDLVPMEPSNSETPKFDWDRCPRIISTPLFFILQLLSKAFFVEETVAKKVPLLRGKIHLLLVYLSPLWIGCLLRCCRSNMAVFSVILACVASLFNFTASALLHNCSWSNVMFRIMTKLDYVGIFLMISGSCSPIPILLLESTRRILLLIGQWSGAFLGVTITLFGQYSDDNQVSRAAVYIVVGLSNCFFLKIFLECLTIFEFVNLCVMGAFYVIGAVCYARKSPNLWPGVFGYHELFHFCCLLAGICTFMVNHSVVSRGDLSSLSGSSFNLLQL